MTQDNKKDYVEYVLQAVPSDVLFSFSDVTLFCRAVIEYRIQKRVKEQFEAFMSGFSELIPQELINVFDERELEVRDAILLLSERLN